MNYTLMYSDMQEIQAGEIPAHVNEHKESVSCEKEISHPHSPSTPSHL